LKRMSDEVIPRLNGIPKVIEKEIVAVDTNVDTNIASVVKSNSDTIIQRGKSISTPHENDVLLGRGGKNNQWSGNETLRLFALELSTTYRTALKRNKPSIAWVLVTKMRGLNPRSR
jgi:hypothetical protein